MRESIGALSCACLLLTACAAAEVPTDPPATDWGPLAVARGGGTGDRALSGGILEIGDTCVFLTRQGQRTLVVWPSAQTLWDGANRTIGFRNRDGAIHRLFAGQLVSFGGGGFSRVEAGEPPENFIAGIDWASPPRPECVTPEIWSVGEVVSF